jgi:hypothetical protein
MFSFTPLEPAPLFPFTSTWFMSGLIRVTVRSQSPRGLRDQQRLVYGTDPVKGGTLLHRDSNASPRCLVLLPAVQRSMQLDNHRATSFERSSSVKMSMSSTNGP